MLRRTRAGLLSIAMVPLGVGLAVGAPTTPAGRAAAEGPPSFSRQIAPLFEARCLECHDTETKEAGLDLSTYESVMKGSEYGTVIEAGDVAGSLLIEMVTAGEMPQDAEPLSEEEIAMLRAWIEAGAANN